MQRLVSRPARESATFAASQRLLGRAMVRYAVIVVLLVFVAVLADRVAREENQRYAMLQGMCRQVGSPDLADLGCLNAVQTRSSWAWQVYHGVTDQIPAVDWTSAG